MAQIPRHEIRRVIDESFHTWGLTAQRDLKTGRLVKGELSRLKELLTEDLSRFLKERDDS